MNVTPKELKRARSLLGLTQQQLAASVGVHLVTLARWETGVHRIPKAVAALLHRLVAETEKGVKRTRKT
jgi:DNA-binding transcriptional regulator YiaG